MCRQRDGDVEIILKVFETPKIIKHDVEPHGFMKRMHNPLLCSTPTDEEDNIYIPTSACLPFKPPYLPRLSSS